MSNPGTVLLVGVSDPTTLAALAKAGHTTEVLPSRCSEQELKRVITRGVDAVILDSATPFPPSVLDATSHATNIKIVAVAGVSVANVDVDACTRRGWMVVNSPDGFTTAVAEFTMASILSMARHIPQAHASMAAGKWDRKDFMGKEMRGATLGVIGFGRIGRRVAQYAKAAGMRVLAADPFVTKGTAQERGVVLSSLEDLMASADVVTVHVAPTQKPILTAELFARAKKGQYFINTSSYGVVDEAALAEALNNGRIQSAVVDSFGTEVPASSPLRKCKRITITHGIASVTSEAQATVAAEAVTQVIDVLRGLPATHAVNLTSMRSELMGPVRPYMSIAERLGYLAAASCGTRGITTVLIDYSGTLASLDTAPLTTMVLKGLLSFNTTSVNYVNAQLISEQRGIKVRTTTSVAAVYTSLISVKVGAADSVAVDVGGTYIQGMGDRIVSYNGITIDLRPEGHMLFMESSDVPGVLGGICTFLGNHKVNIATLDLGRVSQGGKAISGYNIDRGLTNEEMQKLLLQGLPVHSVFAVHFPPLEGGTSALEDRLKPTSKL
jgi:D-3-phosphoglycerate dehydrogenase